MSPTQSLSITAFTRNLALRRCLLLTAWIMASASPLRWMLSALAQPAHVVQRGVLLCLATLGLYYFLPRLQSPHAHPQALRIMLLGVAFAAITRVASDVQSMHAAAALLLLYAVGASFMDAQAWRQRLTLLMALLLCLPIQPHVDAYLGLPLRLWTAQAIAPLLQMLGVYNVTVESIIVTENGVADVASACSGVRTLWYAIALWLGARLLWPQVPSLRWWLAGGLSAAVAVGFNALRVTALVLALHHQAPPLLTDMAHAALGLLALAAVGAINLLLCRCPAATPPLPKQGRVLSWQSHALLAGLMACVALLPSPSRSTADSARLHPLIWPAMLQTEALPLSVEEQDLVLGHHATVAEKRRFNFQGAQGSLLAVESSNWRAHHAPELCLLAQGAHLERLTRISTQNGEFRVMTMQAGAQTAITWFQSDQRVLADLGARLWSQLLHPQERWSLITLVVEGPISAATALDLHHAVHAVVATSHQELP